MLTWSQEGGSLWSDVHSCSHSSAGSRPQRVLPRLALLRRKPCLLRRLPRTRPRAPTSRRATLMVLGQRTPNITTAGVGATIDGQVAITAVGTGGQDVTIAGDTG